MPLLVTGSIGIDTVTTPYGKRENCLGGSAVYFSMAASFFCPVRFVGVIGTDCPFNLNEIFEGRDVDLRGLEVRNFAKTFRWKGSYHNSAADAITENIELNVLAEQPPTVPAEFKDSKFVFLANTAPALQMKLLEQVDRPLFVAADTMTCWIDSRKEDLQQMLKKISCLFINSEEAKSLAKETSLVKAADTILKMGPKIVVIKKGESGSLMASQQGDKFILPAYPAADVKDPTGAGDSFAGGFMGYIAGIGKSDLTSLKQAIAYGTVLASFAISEFSLEGLSKISRDSIDLRFAELQNLVKF
jgi:sugar/nucleoside kinase (ribokinase family)